MCWVCVDEYAPKVLTLKREISTRFGIGLEGGPWVIHKDRKMVVSACKALTGKHILPHDRRKVLEDLVLQYYKVEEMNDTLLEEGLKLSVMEKGDGFMYHGEKCVSKMNIDEIVEFVKMWRRNYLEHVKPKFLSLNWNIYANVIKE